MKTKRRKIPEKRNWQKLNISALFLCFVLTSLIIWFVDPKLLQNIGIDGMYLSMGALLWLCMFLFLKLFFKMERALPWSTGILIFLYFRLWKMGSLINGLLLLGILVSVEIYLRQKKLPEE